MFGSAIRNSGVYVAAIAFFAIVSLLAYFATQAVDMTDAGKKQRDKTYTRTLAEGVKIGRHGLYGVDLVTCGSCRVQKRKRGIFTLGAMNVLVLDDLKVVLPPDTEDSAQRSEEGGPAKDIVRRMGISDGFLKDRGLPMKFSGLKINELSVSRLKTDNTPEKAFTAKSAEAVRGGLKLSGCVVYGSDGSHQPVSGAVVARTDRKLRLKWNGGSMDLN